MEPYKREIYQKTNFFCSCALLLFGACLLLALLPSLARGEPAMVQKINQTIEAVNVLDRSAFKNKNMKNALTNKLDAVLEMIAEDAYQESLNKLEQDILSKMDGCAESGAPDRNDWLIDCTAQMEINPLIREAMGLITLWYESFSSVFEEYPGWKIPDLSVNGLAVDPERSDPGDPVTFHANVANTGKGVADSAALLFLVDDQVIDRISLSRLVPGMNVDVTATWTAETPGRHWVRAEVEGGEGVVDRVFSNDTQTVSAWVSGEAVPEPELEFDDIDIEALDLTAGEPALIPVRVRNPSFAQISDIPVFFYIDGEPVGSPDDDCIPGPDVSCPPSYYGDVISLGPGEEQELHVPWSEVTPGQHTVQVIMGLPESFPDAEFKYVVSWDFIIPYVAALICSDPGKDRWASLGPSTLTDIPVDYYGHTHMGKEGNVGRMDHIAFHTTNKNIIYATAPTGGLWKTGDGGDNWFPVTDGLATLKTSAVAVDPARPNVVYLATPKGIFKSVNGGQSWSTSAFAPASVVGTVREMIVRNPAAGQVLIYAAGNMGVSRYWSSSPLAMKSDPADWGDPIKTGKIVDIVAHPGNNSTLYVSVSGGTPGDGVYRTRNGETASGDTDWSPINTGLPSGRLPVLGIFDGDPKILYAAITNPLGPCCGIEQLPFLGIYKTVNEGDMWDLKEFEFVGNNGYNDFIRVDPLNKDRVYFGGVHFYMRDFSNPSGSPTMVGNNAVHDDMKDLSFDPFNQNYYYILSDGSIWRCRSGSTSDCTARSYDLRTTQFFDIDISRTNSNLMIGGTQDNGTILYQGSRNWKSIKGGDGNYSLIAPGNNKLYAQHQFLDSTVRCDKGINCWWMDWITANGINETCKQNNSCNSLPKGSKWTGFTDGWNRAHITAHPNDPGGNYLLSQGDQVYVTTDGGKNWYPKGPQGTNVKKDSFVTRVVVQPTTFTWIAGNSKGQIWYTSNPNAGWTLLDEHPFDAGVRSMAFSPADHKVLYVTFNASGTQGYTRIWRYEMNPGPPVTWSPSNITDNFRVDLSPQVISGDGHDADIAYVGTNAGGVYRWDAAKPTYESWQPYNFCLPGAVDVRDLIVAPNKELRAATWGRGAWSVVTGP